MLRSVYLPFPSRHLATCVDPSRWKIIPRRDSTVLCTRVTRGDRSSARFAANRMNGERDPRADVTVDNSEISVRRLLSLRGGTGPEKRETEGFTTFNGQGGKREGRGRKRRGRVNIISKRRKLQALGAIDLTWHARAFYTCRRANSMCKQHTSLSTRRAFYLQETTSPPSARPCGAFD